MRTARIKKGQPVTFAGYNGIDYHAVVLGLRHGIASIIYFVGGLTEATARIPLADHRLFPQD